MARRVSASAAGAVACVTGREARAPPSEPAQPSSPGASASRPDGRRAARARPAPQEGDGCDYVIVLQQGKGLFDPEPLPRLPRNARYLKHENKCFDIGTVGWVLEKHVDRRCGLYRLVTAASPAQLRPMLPSAAGGACVSPHYTPSAPPAQKRHTCICPTLAPALCAPPRKYTYFVWLNSSVRGPFMPVYAAARMHWTEAYTSKLTNVVKLVGSTVNCGGAYGRPPVPHVQTYVVATDRVGLQVRPSAGSLGGAVLCCAARGGRALMIWPASGVRRRSCVGCSQPASAAGLGVSAEEQQLMCPTVAQPSCGKRLCNLGWPVSSSACVPATASRAGLRAGGRTRLQVLLEKGTVFHCWEGMADTVIHSEIGATQAIVEAGFTFDSLMLRYQVSARGSTAQHGQHTGMCQPGEGLAVSTHGQGVHASAPHGAHHLQSMLSSCWVGDSCQCLLAAAGRTAQ